MVEHADPKGTMFTPRKKVLELEVYSYLVGPDVIKLDDNNKTVSLLLRDYPLEVGKKYRLTLEDA